MLGLPVVFTVVLLSASHAFDWPSPIIPGPLGVNIHFTNPQPGEMDMLAAGGWQYYRMDLTWQFIEQQKGVYDFSGYDTLLASSNLKALLIMDYWNPLYGNTPPSTAEQIQAFVNFAQAAMARYAGRGVLWEMWNEPNLSYAWPPKPNVTAYANLAKAVGAMKQANFPDEIYMGPCASSFDFQWVEQTFQLGVLEYFDAVSQHGYGENPWDYPGNYHTLEGLIQKYKPSSRPTPPIVCSEWGLSALLKGNVLDVQTQARFFFEQAVSVLTTNTALLIWYDWHDDGTDPDNGEDHFGTVENQYFAGRNPVYNPKPAYSTMQTLVQLLTGFVYSHTLSSPPLTYAIEFQKPGNTSYAVIAAWSTVNINVPMEFPIASGGCYKAVDYVGNPKASGCVSQGQTKFRMSVMYPVWVSVPL